MNKSCQLALNFADSFFLFAVLAQLFFVQCAHNYAVRIVTNVVFWAFT